MAASEKVVYFDSYCPTFKKEMVEYIRKYYRDALGKDIILLDTPRGLDILAAKMRNIHKDFN